MTKPDRVAIVGLGRFGKVLVRLLQDEFSLVLYDRKPRSLDGIQSSRSVHKASNLAEALSCPVVFYAVPISSFRDTLARHASSLRPGQLVIDVLSVKQYAADVIATQLNATGVRAMLTHPLFGPDSSVNGFDGLPIVVSQFTATRRQYEFWTSFFRSKGLRVVPMDPGTHDRLAANSQGVAHFIGRLLETAGFEPTPIDTVGMQKLHELRQQVCNDSWALFADLQHKNKHTRRMRARLGRAYDKLYDSLLPKRLNRDGRGRLVVGIQGGAGSFNEQAIGDYVRAEGLVSVRLKYLYTTEKVLGALHRGDVDLGWFAIQNSTTGMVRESLWSLSKYRCRVVAEFPMAIRHFLMRRQDCRVDSPAEIMAHEEVFKQCRATLASKYPQATQVAGEGDLIDTARAALALSRGQVDPHRFILGPIRLAELYGLVVVDGDLQDRSDNVTTFLLVAR